VIKSDKKLKELEQLLAKKNSLQIVQAVKALREEEAFEGAVALLTETFDNSDDRSVIKVIGTFFNDLKDSSVRPEIIREIRKPWKDNTISMLVSSCWQSGLDYSDYIEDMVNLYIKSDYATSIECMTVIEGSVSEVSLERKKEIVKIINDAAPAWVNEKSGLSSELVSIIEGVD